MRLNKNLANKILGNTENECQFLSSDGDSFSSLKDLWRGIKKMDDNTFLYHTDKGKNDFSNWIRRCLGDARLADSLIGLNRKKSLDKIGARIIYVEKYIEGKL